MDPKKNLVIYIDHEKKIVGLPQIYTLTLSYYKRQIAHRQYKFDQDGGWDRFRY